MEGKDVFTTVVRVKGSTIHEVVPVRSTEAIDKNLWIECSKALCRIHVGPPINIGDIICKNILNTNVDIVATKKIGRNL